MNSGSSPANHSQFSNAALNANDAMSAHPIVILITYHLLFSGLILYTGYPSVYAIRLKNRIWNHSLRQSGGVSRWRGVGVVGRRYRRVGEEREVRKSEEARVGRCGSEEGGGR